ncbi:transglycosylase SLT domain-containing protein [Halobacteriovorax sp. HFRX-2_2]|uniref:transglycosylase SLT domain-containing protein n=1 Tax=unclassified Halobacteriovorax TaxID=2639665 RepID=UPI00371748ED
MNMALKPTFRQHIVRVLLRASFSALFFGATLLFTSCAGPMNPFGSDTLSIINDGDSFENLEAFTNILDNHLNFDNVGTSTIGIEFFPKKQNRHTIYDLYIKINSTRGKLNPENIVIFWNGRNITSSFKNNNKVIYEDDQNIIYKINRLSLPARLETDIKIGYQYRGEIRSLYRYEEPSCKQFTTANNKTTITTTDPFNVKTSFIDLVKREASKVHTNPSMLLGIIAQESGFNYRSVSSAKAIGLTQVTDAASQHVIKKYDTWKVDKRIEKLPYGLVKFMVRSGKINQNNDWRLNRKKSVIGGLEYIEYLKKYWRGNIDLVQKSYPKIKNLKTFEKSQLYTDLILASYNSGPFRVKSQLIKLETDWRNSDRLQEAKNYINRVNSYCYHFTQNDTQGVINEDQAINL